MLLRDFIHSSRLSLSELYGVEEATAMIAHLCEALLDCSPYSHIVEPDRRIPPEKEALLERALHRLLAHEPLQYVLGYVDFMGMRLRVSPAVLIPRPETEDMCRRIVQRYAEFAPTVPSTSVVPRRILDLCCGSGCISWAMAQAFPQAEVYAVDLSEEALEIAKNQQVLRVRPPRFLHADVLDVAQILSLFPDQHFDLIISNPPYVCCSERYLMRENVLNYEPDMALFVPDEQPLKFYTQIARIFSSIGAPNSLCVLEINENFSEEVKNIFDKKQYCTAVERDLHEKNRFVFAKKLKAE